MKQRKWNENETLSILGGVETPPYKDARGPDAVNTFLAEGGLHHSRRATAVVPRDKVRARIGRV